MINPFLYPYYNPNPHLYPSQHPNSSSAPRPKNSLPNQNPGSVPPNPLFIPLPFFPPFNLPNPSFAPRPQGLGLNLSQGAEQPKATSESKSKENLVFSVPPPLQNKKTTKRTISVAGRLIPKSSPDTPEKSTVYFPNNPNSMEEPAPKAKKVPYEDLPAPASPEKMRALKTLATLTINTLDFYQYLSDDFKKNHPTVDLPTYNKDIETHSKRNFDREVQSWRRSLHTILLNPLIEEKIQNLNIIKSTETNPLRDQFKHIEDYFLKVRNAFQICSDIPSNSQEADLSYPQSDKEITELRTLHRVRQATMGILSPKFLTLVEVLALETQNLDSAIQILNNEEPFLQLSDSAIENAVKSLFKESSSRETSPLEGNSPLKIDSDFFSSSR